MKIVYEYSHLGGRQILQGDYPDYFAGEIGKTVGELENYILNNT